MKINKIILTILILSIVTLVFSGCGGGNLITPPADTEDSEIPEPTETMSQKIDLSVGGTIEVTDQESLINGVKLIIPPTSSNKNVKDSIATIIISYIDDPYSLELPDNRGFLLPPVVINSDVILDVECVLEIPYTEADLSNMGLSGNENIKVYRYNYNSSSWEEISINKRSSRDMSDILEIIFRPEDIDSPYACTFLNAAPPSDLGLPQPGDLLYKLSTYKGINGWLPGHVGIYVGEFEKDNKGKPYNVIEELFGGVKRNYFNPISDFSRGATYMGARQPESGILNPGQRKVIVAWAETIAELELPYSIGQSFPGILFGMLQGNMVKGALGSYNCVGLAEKAYEIAGVNGGQGLVSDWDEGNSCIQYTCILTPAEQYNKTEPAEGYTVSGWVTDSQGNGIPSVILNFELVSFNDYHNSVEVITNSGGYWSSNKLGREWNVTPQKDGYTFEPSTLHEGWVKPDPSTWIVKGNANDIDFTGMSDEPQNHPPIITSTAGTSATKGQPYSYDVNATDSDGDIPVYSLTNNPSGMTINFSTGLITWTPTATGSFGVTVKASDGELFDTQSFTVTVEETGTTTLPAVPTSLSPGTTSAPGPTISTLTPTLQWQAVSNADYYNLSVSIYPYGTSNIIYYNQQVYGNSITVPSGELQAGNKYRWNMRAHNSAGYSDYSLDYYFQTVTTTTLPPTLTLVGSGGVSPGSGTPSTTFTYSVYYSDPEGASPTVKNVYIDGSSHTMSGSGSGSTYTYQISGLSAGTHTYSFQFSDGTTTVNLPTSGTYAAPTVTSTLVPPTGFSVSSYWNTVSPGFPSMSLSWNAVSGATGYEMWVRPSGGSYASLGTRDAPYVTFNSNSLPGGARYVSGTTYYFKVRTVTASGTSDFTSEVSCVAAASPTTSLGQVQLSSPGNGFTLPPMNITFIWNFVSNATKYEIIIYNPLGQVALDQTTTNIHIIVALGTEETITWKVRAGDDSGNWGAWSSTWSLTIKTFT